MFSLISYKKKEADVQSGVRNGNTKVINYKETGCSIDTVSIASQSAVKHQCVGERQQKSRF